MHKELVFLGTGEAMATKCYNTCFVVRAGEENLLVDAGGGNGILAQLEKAQMTTAGLDCLFVTHTHTDHILGAVWLLRDIAQQTAASSYRGRLHVYGHDEAIATLKALCGLLLGSAMLRCVEKSVALHTVEDGETVNMREMKLRFFDIHSTKCRQFGVTILFNDGTRMAYLGDEPYHDINRAYVLGADWLVSEAFCLHRDIGTFRPYEINHATALDAGGNAQKLNAKNLVIVHTEDSNLAQRKTLYAAEAQKAFQGNVFVPDDLEHIIL